MVDIEGKILVTAIKLFIENGFFETSIKGLMEELNIKKDYFYQCFKSKEDLINNVIERFWIPYINRIIGISNKCITSEEKLLIIFKEYSEIESYFIKKFNVKNFYYKSIIFLTIEGRAYEYTWNDIIELNAKLLDEIGLIIEDGKRKGEILNMVNSSNVSREVLSLLQSNIVLWVMNPQINIKKLYETSFKYLWRSIRNHHEVIL